jgi:hypothetical protein
MVRKIRPISQAHEWIQAQGLSDSRGAVLSTPMQDDGRHVPTLAMDDPFSGAEPTEFFVESTDEKARDAIGYCDGVLFPDGSAIWWTEGEDSIWSFTDGHGFDITENWQVNEAVRTKRR